MKRTRSKFRVALVVLVTLVTVVGTAQGASAYAYGVATWSPLCVGDICVPAGVLEHTVTGDGLTVPEEWAQAESFALMCNTRMNFQYYDVNNNRYRVSTGELWDWCGREFNRKVYPGTLRPGRACAVFYASGVEIVRQCHQIAR